MEITDKQLDKFIAIYKDKYNREISRKEAHEQASSLLLLARAAIEGQASRPLTESVGEAASPLLDTD